MRIAAPGDALFVGGLSVATATMGSMQINDLLDLPVVPMTTWSTGLAGLDRLTGGMQAGTLWLITGHPGQGKTTLLTQLASRCAVQHQMFTVLSCPRERPGMVRARLLSLATGRPLTFPVLGVGELTDYDTEKVQALRDAPMLIEAGTGIANPDWSNVSDRPRCLAVDDGGHGGTSMPAALRAAADGGAFVVVSVPRHHVVSGPTWGDPLHPEWAQIADLVLEIDSTHDDVLPGDATVRIHRNRWGPLIDFEVADACFRARFADSVA